MRQAREAGIIAFINPSVNLKDSHHVVKLAERSSDVYAAVGFHPNDARLCDDDALAQLRELAGHSKVVSIGEIGLDYHWDKTPRLVQKQVFEQQLELATELKLPVIIHQRESGDDMMAVLRSWAKSHDHPGLVLHSFSGDVAMAEESVELGFYIGISGPVTFKNSRDLPDVVAAVPLNRLLVETDAPFLSPHPFRGKRNQPERVNIIAEKMAEIKKISLAEISQHLTENTIRLFGLKAQRDFVAQN
jgi:TatD DNase family protein